MPGGGWLERRLQRLTSGGGGGVVSGTWYRRPQDVWGALWNVCITAHPAVAVAWPEMSSSDGGEVCGIGGCDRAGQADACMRGCSQTRGLGCSGAGHRMETGLVGEQRAVASRGGRRGAHL